MRTLRHIRTLIVISEKIIAAVRVFRPGLAVAGILAFSTFGSAFAQTDTAKHVLTKEEKAYLKQDEKAWKKAKSKMAPLEFKQVVQERDQFKVDVDKYKEILDKVQAEMDTRMTEISGLKAENSRYKASMDSLRMVNNTQSGLLADAAKSSPAFANKLKAYNAQAAAPAGTNSLTGNLNGSPVTTGIEPVQTVAAQTKTAATGVTGKANNLIKSASVNRKPAGEDAEADNTGTTAAAGTAKEPMGVTANVGTLPAGVVFKVQIGAFRNRNLQKYLNNSRNFTGEVDPDGLRKYTLGFFGDYWEADNFKKYMREMGVNDAWIVTYKDGKRVNIKDVLEKAVSATPQQEAEPEDFSKIPAGMISMAGPRDFK
ncbi:MAG: hypothetical protein V4543_02160 [Bacteroidota bacterium]